MSILEASWGEDIIKFKPSLNYGIAYAKNRKKIFEDDSYDVVITNFEAVNFLHKHPLLLKRFNTIVIDEFTAFKNREAKRSKNLKSIIHNFDNRIAMSGTPNSNTILDLWHPVFLIDDGEHLETGSGHLDIKSVNLGLMGLLMSGSTSPVLKQLLQINFQISPYVMQLMTVWICLTIL